MIDEFFYADPLAYLLFSSDLTWKRQLAQIASVVSFELLSETRNECEWRELPVSEP
jgi:hypothetical protein